MAATPKSSRLKTLLRKKSFASLTAKVKAEPNNKNLMSNFVVVDGAKAEQSIL